ncbi:MAG: isoprenylcysteine carboxylmethyltransferase family protein [Woeseiaceae bacterium]|nr:isoprenylcysteine carboxylmethyltransferase family protein [Woeseiaceae bacterium]
MARVFTLLFSLTSYCLFLLVFLYLIAFLGNFQQTALADAVPLIDRVVVYSIDTGRAAPGFIEALAVNLGLIALFGLQHSVMARQGFKRAWTRVVPQPAERSVYVLLSSVVLALVIWQWRPMPTPVLWAADAMWSAAIGWSVMALGILILLWSTFLIDHFDLFGLKQAWARFRERPVEPPRFMTPMLYRIVRHPLYVGWFLIFWGTPRMSLGHLLFAAGMSAYIFVAIRYEERDLVSFHGEKYEQYRQQVPMVVPVPGRHYNG